MRRMLFSCLIVVAPWGMAASAQGQAGTQAAQPAAPNVNAANPPARRMFFFMQDQKNMGQATKFGPAPQLRGTASLFAPDLRTYFITHRAPQYSGYQGPKFSPTGLLPVEGLHPRDSWYFLLRRNTRLYFFRKP